MPCGDTTDYDYENDSLRNKLKAATRAACELARAVTAQSFFESVSKETQDWVRHHEELDKRRIKEEEKQQRRKALEKTAMKKLKKVLSKEEREVLGI